MDDGGFVPVSVVTMKPTRGKSSPRVMLDFGDQPTRSVPRRGPILEASIPHQRGVAGLAAGLGEQVLDRPLQYLIGREADSIGHVPPFQCLVQRGKGGEGKGRPGSRPASRTPTAGSRRVEKT
jgi:hypothetical protein